jgi:hypothetical protein
MVTKSQDVILRITRPIAAPLSNLLVIVLFHFVSLYCALRSVLKYD